LALVSLSGPRIFDDFVNPKKEFVRGRIFWGTGAGELLVGEGIGCSARLGEEYFLILQNDGSS
jgi:hypothetical protein